MGKDRNRGSVRLQRRGFLLSKRRKFAEIPVMKRTLRTLLLAATLVVAHFALSSNSFAADFSAIWDGGNGNWGDALHWNTNPNYPDNAGGVTYDATINSGNVTLDRNITIQRLFFSNGIVGGGFELTLNDGLTWSGGRIGSIVNLATGSASTIAPNSSSSSYLDGATINNSGSVTQSAGVYAGTGGAIINNLAGATWVVQQGAGMYGFNGPFTFNNAGDFIVSGTFFSPFATFNNIGTMKLEAGGGVRFEQGGSASGTFDVAAGADLVFGGFDTPSTSYTLNAGALINGPGSTVVDGTLTVAGDTTINTSLSNYGTLVVQSGATLTLNGTFDQSFFLGGMVTRLSGGTITSAQPLNFQQGTLAGSGTINANVSLSDHMTLAFQLGGTSAGSSMDSYDQLNVNGAFTLAGTLALAFKSSFESLITNSDKFVLLTSTSGLTGSFTNIASGSRLDTTDGYGSFIVNYNTPHLTLTDFVPNTRWLGGSGNWTDAARWSSNPDYPHNSDSTQYSAAIHSGSVNLDTDITVSRCLMTGGSLTGGHVLTLTEGLVWTFGTIAGSAGSAINLTPNSTSTIALEDFASGQLLSGRTINNAGVVNHSGSIDVGADSSINNLAGATWNMQRDASMGFNFNGHLTFNNFGNVVLLGGNESSVVQVLAVFNNNGSVELQNGVELKLSGGGTASGAFTLGSLSEILFAQGSPNNPYTFTSGAVIKGTGNVYIDSLALVNVAGNTVVATSLQNGGKLTVASGATLTVTSFESSQAFYPDYATQWWYYYQRSATSTFWLCSGYRLRNQWDYQ